MSVYTELDSLDIQKLLAHYNLGGYQSHQGISAGVENTNYFVETSQHSLVLTIFEKQTAVELPFYLQLAEHLHRKNCPVPQPFRNHNNEFIQTVKSKPCVFVERVRGTHIEASKHSAIEIAKALANIHLATASFDQSKPHSHGAAWVLTKARELMEQLTKPEQQLLKNCIDRIQEIPSALPSGVIHADLFQDNALFEQGKITGIIDWYFAGNDSYILDIAITMNDWCIKNDHQFDVPLGEAFISEYQKVRPLSSEELKYLPHAQVQAATRFWLSRILAKNIHQQSTENITVKNPVIMQCLAAQLINYT